MDRIRLFVSAGPDLEAEQEAIGRAIAELPISLGWMIKRTPVRGEPLAPALKALVESDFYVFILGADIAAPVGVEWDLARQTRKPVLAYLKDVGRTPAAQAFLRTFDLEWTQFETAEDLGRLIQESLAQRILDRAVQYVLSPLEFETLSTFVQKLRGEREVEKPPVGAEPERGGAGGGGVILSPSRDLPAEGVLVGEAKQ